MTYDNIHTGNHIGTSNTYAAKIVDADISVKTIDCDLFNTAKIKCG